MAGQPGHGVFVTGTGTGVGKTAVTGAIASLLGRLGVRVAAFKPVLTGLEEPAESGWPPDHELLAAAAGGLEPHVVAPWRFGPALSPHLAAALAELRLDRHELVEGAWRSRDTAGAQALVVEGVGGLMVPLVEDFLVRDLGCALGLPLVIAAVPDLGTINHTLLTLECARAVGLHVVGVVLTPWPARPGVLECSNRETIAAFGDVDVYELPWVVDPSPGCLADAAEAARLPVEQWCGEGDARSVAAAA
ncbi:MAG: dethiobiotin synthase [Solirubrobacteraceae bacterium]